jgi:uncharacterized protein (DUF2461 family)
MGATVGEAGYVQLTAKGLGAGSGMWIMAADQLERYRSAVAADATGDELVGIVDAIRAARIDVTGHHRLKTAPKGYPRDHPRIELLKNKGLIAWKDWPAGAWMGKRSAKDRVVEFLRTSRPLSGWLDANVGASTLPPDVRR